MKHLAFLILGLGLATQAVSFEYSVIDLGLVGEKPFRPYIINSQGQIAGAIDGDGSELELGYLWQDGHLTPLGTLGGRSCTPSDLNELGEVVGSSTLPNGRVHPFYFSTATGLVDLMTAWPDEEGVARAINSRGQILVVRDEHIWLTDRTGSTWTPIAGLPAATADDAVAITEGGVVLGTSWVENRQRSFLNRAGAVEDLGVVTGFDSTYPLDMTEQEIVTGFVLGESTHRSFLWQDGQIDLVPDLGGGWSAAAAVTNDLTVVGTAHSPRTNDSRGFRQHGGVAVSLNDLVADQTWQLHGADDCAGTSQIIGSGLHQGQWRGYLANPVPEPIPLLALLLSAMFLRRQRR